MRFSTTAILALPLLAAAAESPFEQYKAKFQNFLSSFGVGTPEATVESQPEVASAKKTKIAAKPITRLTLSNWKETLYAPVKPDATQPEEWWVLVSGRNKTCFGHCLQLEAAFNQSATKFAALDQSPHLGLIDCDAEPVLCNSWSASTGVLWTFQMLPEPVPTEIYVKRLNLTTTTADDFVSLYQGTHEESSYRKVEGLFHPLDGVFARYNLAVPLGYLFWGLSVIPSWAMMLIVSFFSRSMMNRQVANMNRDGAPAGAGAPAPRAAPPGDARS